MVLQPAHLAQAEGQGIRTILQTMNAEGCPPPKLAANVADVVCVLPAHPRHAATRVSRAVEQALSLGDLSRAQTLVTALVENDPSNEQVVQLFAEVHRALRAEEPVSRFMERHAVRLRAFSPETLIRLASTQQGSDRGKKAARELYAMIAPEAVGPNEVKEIAQQLVERSERLEALEFLDLHFERLPELASDAEALRMRATTLISLANTCAQSAGRHDLLRVTRVRAKEDAQAYIERAEQDLSRAAAISTTPPLLEQDLTILRRVKTDLPRSV
ncbi:MAG: hypothetical protein IT162_02355 [Bryobacterales bacterium]|nr:hypothetical protein [Bryobacterales bacterium]